MRVGIVGGGIFGVAAADALARRGVDVSLYEAAAELPGPRASSADISKVIRATYGAMTGRYGSLAIEAGQAWRALEAELGERLLHPSSVLLRCARRAEGDFAWDSLTAMRELGAPVELLEPAQVRQRWPALAWDADAVLDVDGGWLEASVAVRALARRAAAHGARLFTNAPVRAVEPGALWCGAEKLAFDLVVVAAGPWVQRLVPGAPASLTRQEIALFRPETPPQIPVWLHDLDTTGYYGFPVHPSGLLKVGRHRLADPTDADDPREPDLAFLEEARAFVHGLLPGLPLDTPLQGRVCLYTSTPTSDLACFCPTPGLLVAGLGSGHAFKFGPVLGRLVADIALTGDAPAWATPAPGTRAVW